MGLVFIVGVVLGGLVGGLYMYSYASCKCWETHKADIRLAQRLINEQYALGYKHGVASVKERAVSHES